MSKKTKKKYRQRRNLLIFFTVCILLVLFSYAIVSSRARKDIVIEAGSDFSTADVLKVKDDKAVFTEKSEAVLTDVPGDYTVYVKSGMFTYKCYVHVQDTIPPKADGVSLTLEHGMTCDATAFIQNLEDATKVNVEFLNVPNFDATNLQDVTVVLTDLGGNKTTVKASLLMAPVINELTWEIGSGYPTADYFVLEGNSCEFVTKDFDVNNVSRQKVTIRVDGREYDSILNVVDTVKPVVQVKDISCYTTSDLKVEDFVVSIQDSTEVEYKYVTEPDMSREGKQSVQISFTDRGGNETIAEAKLFLSLDTEAPMIVGVRDMNYIMGTTLSYRKNVYVMDNCDDDIIVQVDSSQVNSEVEGTYPVVYSATDKAGNKTVITINLTVKPMLYDVEKVYSQADAVLAKIFQDDMSEYERLRAIFDYVKSNVGYISHSDKGDWVQAAYEGLFKKQGDCYVYACTTKVLLDRAGIKNMDIEKIPAKTMHYWNLVDIGDGWYHMDTTPRKDHPVIFYWDDAKMMEYSRTHNDSHNYDHDLYPKVN